MADITAAKSWSVSVAIDPEGFPRFASGDDRAIDIATLSPVEQLLAAIGACFGQSCIALMKFHGWPACGMRALVDGHKPAGPVIGKGLDRVTISVRIDGKMDAGRQTRLLTDAKKICTVTNSLSHAITLMVQPVDQGATA